MMSIAEYERLRRERVSFQEAYQQFLEKHSLAEVGLEAGFAGKVRDRAPGRKVSL
jgi:molybdopterin synthase catalytic subunit